jgi:glycosyltransferase involved in cell wall biosynthesis
MKDSKKLVIISDTPMWYDTQGRVNIYEPTLREIEQVANVFNEVIWLGFNRPGYVFGNGRPTTHPSIQFKLLMPSGGHTFFSKLRSIVLVPYYIIIILKYLITANNIHTRGPSVPALLTVLLSFFFKKKKYWHKYAGNWGADQSPVFYRFQKKLVMKAVFSKVTINGRWPDQLPHILSFENPCFTAKELEWSARAGATKTFHPPYTFCFAGRLEEAKGVGNLLKACSSLASADKIQELILAGDGAAKKDYEIEAKKSLCTVQFMGGLNRDQLNVVYSKSHFMILPSASEGFPKVLAEAAAFGCIPIVTNVSALSQYIQHGVNGFFLENNKPETIQQTIDFILKGEHNLTEISNAAKMLATDFTYEKFVNRLQHKVFSN